MRSRYTAYSMGDMGYIKKTMRGEASLDFDEQEAKDWARGVVWIGLRVTATSIDSDGKGYVTFIAQLVEGERLRSIHETSEFLYEEGGWYYVDGIQHPKDTERTILKNTPCPCGSRKKFKQCHGQRST